ncbi:MAG: hypothetical protein A3F31_01225 [Candidatus Levybacteria bacterium RIFCSPHIGHO2_12_FULL_38_12]|nr:MAG: hypothetical protein A2770_01705 [Candidatus Levybacteria bacterium RIFCSPHIGHO2_01_FULL_38_12]OGH22012.1 MAG: hypothetical protein A3D75_03235 [Candidatus Levybacteria bacterium RIFCSPHIGHO2_02_FULL_37_18]OGH23269.1 MAG: hypothetical protein A3F31_01225 [Candidatus Levybacteria bacterium RIFCSPHIGHO2_12_FULL_38_12]OGH33705.1 MAG: hypothetical protein A3A47_02670 [Candidatus Levybacteria bacterium RIFCSPLOWO2_01_FULL_37_20]OGH44611.1 MAG: hypothetical protein A3J14_00755 [Candidatus Lev
MIDVHCHLNFKRFADDYDEVIKRAYKAGVTTIINVGTKIDSSQKAVELAQKYDNLFAIVGAHPHHADKHELESDWLEQLEKLAKKPKVVAIGEIGMDYYRYQSNGIVDKKLQMEVFQQQIKLAHKLKLPLQIHNRHAGEDIINILLNHKSYLLNPPGMFHCFAGTFEVLKSALQMGFCIGFDGNITYKGVSPGETVALSELAKRISLDRIVIETDSPYLTPQPHRGSRNEPQYAILTGKFIAQIKDISFQELDRQTTENTKRMFRL